MNERSPGSSGALLADGFREPVSLGFVDLRAIKAATRRELAKCAIAAARNAQGLLQDAELLAASGRTARAYSVSVLAVEECGRPWT